MNLVRIGLVLAVLVGLVACTPSVDFNTYPFSRTASAPQAVAPSSLSASASAPGAASAQAAGAPEATAAGGFWRFWRDEPPMRTPPLALLRQLGQLFMSSETAGQQSLYAVDLAQYEQEAVFRYNWTTPRERAAFTAAAETLLLDVWHQDDEYAEVRLNVRRVNDLARLLPKSVRKSRQVLVDDLQRALVVSAPMPGRRRAFFDEFRDLDEIYAWLAERDAPTTLLGYSFEGLEMRGVEVGSGDQLIVVTGGMQGRDWISVSSVLYAIEHFTPPQGFRVLFVPVVNPDGYVYTWSTDRLWKKNREETSVMMCSGVDILASLGGSVGSDTPCSEMYSEESIEGEIIRSTVVNNRGVLFDVGAYGQKLLLNESLSAQSEGLEKQIRDSTGVDYKVSLLHDAPDSIANQIRLRQIEYGYLVHKRHIPTMGEELVNILSSIIA
ncbi:hypothetical protein TRVA0_017S00848 [Trichomonascus vanleenenianus]|uniref:putative metallocarboxypeptidase n=1 Tax=Trichomonascus vanleenenianus TaxID=2268995 RepID=UPI003ECB7F41